MRSELNEQQQVCKGTGTVFVGTKQSTEKRDTRPQGALGLFMRHNYCFQRTMNANWLTTVATTSASILWEASSVNVTSVMSCIRMAKDVKVTHFEFLECRHCGIAHYILYCT